MRRAQVDAAEVGWGEFFYDRATVGGFSYGTFWASEPLGGDCVEVDFVDGAPTVLPCEGPFSHGRVQTFLRRAAAERPALRVSLLFGAHDWVDCRPFVDIAREFPRAVNVASGGRIVRLEACGHQLPVDQPEGLAEAICTACSHAGPCV